MCIYIYILYWYIMVYIYILFMETPKYQVSVSLSILFCSDQALVEFESELFYALCWDVC